MSSDGNDSSSLGMMSSPIMKVVSLVCASLATKLVKNESFLLLNIQYFANLCSYTTYKVLVTILLKLPIFKEKI